MGLAAGLAEREAAGQPVRVGLIGAGAFGTMFLAQARRTPGIHIVAVADREPARARAALARGGWPREDFLATTIAEAASTGRTCVTAEAENLVEVAIDVIVEATGSPAASVDHALAAFAAGCHVVMVTVEGDALTGPMLAQRAAEAGVVYSLASGDQPALICELVDWARTCGLEVVAAGKGTRYHPDFHHSTPDTVWAHYGLDAERALSAGFNAKMFNSFLDGTKSAIEMTAVANATGLRPAPDGLSFPPSARHELASVLRPHEDGGRLATWPTVEVVSSLRRDGSEVRGDLRWGVYVVFRAGDEYVASRLVDYGVDTDESGRYGALYRPSHLIGLELGVSVASVALRGEATGAPAAFVGDAVAVAKRDLAPGDRLDGEGGHTVRAELLPAAESLGRRALPIGLAANVTLARSVVAGETVSWDDVDYIDDDSLAVRLRRELERRGPP